MAGQSIRKLMRGLWLSLGIVVAFSGSLFFLMDGTCLAQAGESGQGESAAQSMDIDRHDHGEGTVDMMVPHQKHRGPHMKWTSLRTANADDAGRADEIVQTLRQALAKYKDYRVAMDDGYVPLHPERTPKHYHFANKERRLMAKVRFDPAEPTALLYKKAGMVMNSRGRCIPRREI
jgi:ABC-type dipeptide/oligopeptide/nickel transport system ATPase subunit